MKQIYLLLASSLPALFLLLARSSMKRGERLRVVAYGATFFHYAVLVLWPAIYAVTSGLEFEEQMAVKVDYGDLARILAWENLYAFIVAAACVLSGWIRRRRPVPPKTAGTRVSWERERTVCRRAYYVLIGGGWLLYVGEAFSVPGSGVVGVGKGGVMLDQITGWMSALLWLPTLVASMMVLTERRALANGVWRFFLALGPVLALLVIGVTTGMRGRITWILSLLLICSYIHGNYRLLKIGALALLISIPALVFLGGGFRRSYSVAVTQGATRSELVATVIEKSKEFWADFDIKDCVRQFGASFAERAQGARNSVVLFDLYDDGSGGGWTPYVGSILFPIPRILYPGKPASGSLSPRAEDAAMYMVMTFGHNVPYMGPSLASANAYWENGWMGVVFGALLTAGIWGGVLAWAERLPKELGILVVVGFLGALLIDGLFTMLNPGFSLVLQFWKVLLPVALIHKAATTRRRFL